MLIRMVNNMLSYPKERCHTATETNIQKLLQAFKNNAVYQNKVYEAGRYLCGLIQILHHLRIYDIRKIISIKNMMPQQLLICIVNIPMRRARRIISSYFALTLSIWAVLFALIYCTIFISFQAYCSIQMCLKYIHWKFNIPQLYWDLNKFLLKIWNKFSYDIIYVCGL